MDGVEHQIEKTSPVTAMITSPDSAEQPDDYDSENDTSDDCQSVSKRDRSAFDALVKPAHCINNAMKTNENNHEESGELKPFRQSPATFSHAEQKSFQNNYTPESFWEIG